MRSLSFSYRVFHEIRVVPLRNTGSAISPFNAFQILQGIETLSLRMERICSNAVAIAEYLKNHPKVAWVNYAGLNDHPDYALLKKYMSAKASGILNFGLKKFEKSGNPIIFIPFFKI